MCGSVGRLFRQFRRFSLLFPGLSGHFYRRGEGGRVKAFVLWFGIKEGHVLILFGVVISSLVPRERIIPTQPSVPVYQVSRVLEEYRCSVHQKRDMCDMDSYSHSKL